MKLFQKAWMLASVAAAILLAGNPARAQDELPQVYHSKTNLSSPNALLAVDLVHTDSPELVVTDAQGQMRILSSQNGTELRALSLGKTWLTAPIAGDFNGDNALDLAVGTGNGDVIFINGQTLDVIDEAKIGSRFGIQPTVYTVKASETEFLKDILLIADQDGVIRSVELNDENKVNVRWEFRSGTKVQSPMVIGSVRERDRPDLVATTGDGHILLLDPINGPSGEEDDKILLQEQTPLTHSALLIDVDADRLDEVVVSFGGGLIWCLKWNRSLKPKLQPVWRANANTAPVAPPVLVQKGTRQDTRRIVQLTESNIKALDLRGQTVAEELTSYSGINTQIALVPSEGRYPEMAFGIGQTMQLTRNMTEWLEQGVLLESRQGTLRHTLEHTLATVVPNRDDPALIMGISAQQGGHLYSFDTGMLLSRTDWPTLTPWMTQGGSPYHNPMLDRQWTLVEVTRRMDLKAQAQGWRDDVETALAESDWVAAYEAAEKLVQYDPLDQEFQSLHLQIRIKRHFFKIITTIIVVLLAGGFMGFQIIQWMRFRSMRLRAEAAVARGEHDEARRFYQRLRSKKPRKDRIAYALAKVYATQHDYSEETLPVYRQAHHLDPNDHEILNAYARALLLEPKTSDEAMRVYERAIPNFPEPALLEYGIGRCYLAMQEYEEAGKRLRSALRGGVATEGLYHALCEVYLKTKSYTAKALPVFQQQFPSRRDDREFLIAYLAACIDGKQMDAQVESLCQNVLEVSPEYVPAYLQLARILMQKKQMGTAVEEINNALRFDPGNEEAFALQAQCYLAQNRRDDDALQVYGRALELDKSNAELLRIMSAIYFERDQFDESSIPIYHRCAEANPLDMTTLRALAKTARLTTNHDLSIRVLETISEVGTLSVEQTIQLANAYVKNEVFEERTEKVLRAALKEQPGNGELITALAHTLILQDRTDAESIPVFESHLAHDEENLATGRQLAKAYIGANRYEEALKTAQRFLKKSPEDEELQRLSALASLYDNKIDEAVQEYRHILDRNPNDEEALVNLALAYGQKLRVDEEAETLYRRALELEPGSDLLHLALARVHGSRKDAVKAVECYESALRAQKHNEQKVIAHIMNLLSERPELLRVRWFFVELLVSYGHLRESLEQIEFISQSHQGQEQNVLRGVGIILKKDPQNVKALAIHGNMQLSFGEVDDAIKALEKAYKLRPAAPDIQEALIRSYKQKLEKVDNPEARFKLGRIYYAQQEYDEAIGCFQKTAQDYRWEAESAKMLGKCFASKGMLDLALQEYKKLVVDGEAKELLYELAQRYESKKDLVGAKTVYRQLFAADIDYKDVKTRFEMLSGSTSDPMAFEKTAIVQQMSEEAARRYELLDELGRGAMGIVYRARDKELEEIVALKILPDNMSNNPEAVRRFKVEARNARKLSHPNIVRIHDIGEEMGRKYISMEYVEGTDLKKKIKANPDVRLPREQVVRYIMQISDALGYAHRLQIVHRDIKPANIMLTAKDEVKVTDFGIAKMMDSTGEGTMVGAVIGTPLYMSPEQVQGLAVDNRADIYSLGVLLYELFAGRPPFREGDLAYQHLHKKPEPIEGLPEPLWKIVAKSLEKKKEDRWEKAEDIYESLREYWNSIKAT